MANETGLIYSLIPRAMEKIGHISKSKKNAQQGFMFRGIDDVYLAAQPVLAELGMFSVPEILEETREERQSRGGGALIYTILKVSYKLFAPDGSYVSAIVRGEGMDSGDKSGNKALSIAHKYFFFQVFCIPTDEPDADSETHAVETKKPEINKNLSPDYRYASGVTCLTCGEHLILSKSGKGYYCPNYEDKKNGEHTRFPVEQYETFKREQQAFEPDVKQ
jgi:hypothetical protein